MGPGSPLVDSGSGVGLTPAVVVFASGEKNLLAAGMRWQTALGPEREEFGREMGVVGLRHYPQTGALVEDDQSATKDSPTPA